MSKKLMILGAVLAVIGGVVAMSAWEAHVINVTAHIENAMSVSPEEIAFGTVFPEEVFHRTFEVACSQSFKNTARVDDITYEIVMKPKPFGDPRTVIQPSGLDPLPAWDFCLNHTAHPDYLNYCYRNLCPLLDLVNSEKEDDTPEDAFLAKTENDCSDLWSIKFTVPCIAGYTPQNVDCATISENDKDWGCDIWVEGSGISPNEAQCNDRLDNDQDTLIDYPADPGCTSPYDNNEIDPVL